MMSIRSVMLRLTRTSVLAVAVLLAATLGGPQTAVAQPSSVDADNLVSSLTQTVSAAPSDSALANAAAALLEARAETEISFSTYKKGVQVFQNVRPDFYGNFFGDPFYATYDVDYFRMDRLRGRVGLDVARPSGLPGLFSCNPFAYDPAFRGACRGFRFAAADFVLRPPGPHSSFPFRTYSNTDRFPFVVSAAFFYPPAGDDWRADDWRDQAHSAPTDLYASAPPTPDVPESAHADAERFASNAGNEAEPVTPAEVDPETDIEPVSTVGEVEVPDEVASRMQERASILRQKAVTARMRYEIERRYGDLDDLSPRVRAQLANRLAETGSSHDERVDESLHTLNRTGQIDRLGIRERIRQLDRLENSGGSGSQFERTPSDRDQEILNSASDENGPVLTDDGGSRTPDAGSPDLDTPGRSTPSRSQGSSREVGVTDDSG